MCKYSSDIIMMFHLYYTVFNSESIQRNLRTSNIMVTVNMFIVDALILRIVSHPLVSQTTHTFKPQQICVSRNVHVHAIFESNN